jgi:predicted PurR-regulated permease PerM
MFFGFLYILLPFAWAVIAGAVLALALSTIHQTLIAKGFKGWQAISLIMGAIAVFAFAPTLAFIVRGSKIITKAIKDPVLIAESDAFKGKLLKQIENIAPTFGFEISDIDNLIRERAEQIAGVLLKVFNTFLVEIPSIVMLLAISMVLVCFFLAHDQKIRQLFDHYFSFSTKNGNKFIKVLKSSCREVFLVNVATGILQASVVAIGSVIFKVGDWFLVFFIAYICSFVPIIGAGPIAMILSLYSFAVGNNGAGVGMLVISIVSGTADNILRPYLATFGSVAVPGVIGFLAVIGGVITFGLPGLFIGPLVASFFFGLLPIVIEEFTGGRR